MHIIRILIRILYIRITYTYWKLAHKLCLSASWPSAGPPLNVMAFERILGETLYVLLPQGDQGLAASRTLAESLRPAAHPGPPVQPGPSAGGPARALSRRGTALGSLYAKLLF